MGNKVDEINTLDSNLDVLNTFKDTKLTREDRLLKEAKRYETLKRELENLKRKGKIEMEDQKQKLIKQQENDMQALKDKATQDAEKNISEIERNI